MKLRTLEEGARKINDSVSVGPKCTQVTLKGLEYKRQRFKQHLFFLSKTVPKEAPAPTCHLENENLEEFLFISPRSIITLSVKRRSVGECS